ncbi:hypothetical protein HG535_0A05550 [Zygotorulaspora mrakii]|uniref:Uncharacterized protein n=1 Tax=Zygotorulaspora mrakii TaxID=42260 RepID=A0A7H9AWZ1_ZYGMR|nr:uncharacterized protein HG535_0A05550 [Zygotorulaspora mrakii]QLG70614.1 hypothetical protein HG535_0A05550 [Zygotorulaspora mrakii]
MLEWQRVRELIRADKLEQLVRSEKVTEAYRKHKLECDVQQYVLENLNWSPSEVRRLNDEGVKFFSDRSLYTLTQNDYPYDFEPTIHHLIIWSKIYIPLYNDKNEKNDKVEEELDNFVNEHIAKFALPADDYIWFMNTSPLQSIKNISHLHLLVKVPVDQENVVEQILQNF